MRNTHAFGTMAFASAIVLFSTPAVTDGVTPSMLTPTTNPMGPCGTTQPVYDYVVREILSPSFDPAKQTRMIRWAPHQNTQNDEDDDDNIYKTQGDFLDVSNPNPFDTDITTLPNTAANPAPAVGHYIELRVILKDVKNYTFYPVSAPGAIDGVGVGDPTNKTKLCYFNKIVESKYDTSNNLTEQVAVFYTPVLKSTGGSTLGYFNIGLILKSGTSIFIDPKITNYG